MYQQREAPEPLTTEGGRPWAPEVLATRDWVASPSALYVVVDDIDDQIGVAVTVEAGWPTVDEFGRLSFPSGVGSETARRIEVLTAEVHSARRLLRQPAPTRPLRIGDTFYVEPDGDAWGAVVDVTADARDAAKRAFFAAVTPRVTDDSDILGDDRSSPDEGETPRYYRGSGPGPAV